MSSHKISRATWQDRAVKLLLCLLLAGCAAPPGAPTQPSPGMPTPDATTELPQPTPQPESPTGTPAPTLQEVAEAVVSGDGVILSTHTGDPQRLVFLFEEDHRSIASQVQIARVMLRLYEEHGLRSLGLEGWHRTEGDLPTDWAEMAGELTSHQAISGRALVMTQALEEGDLSAAEWLALTHPSVRVQGLDDPTLYAITPEGGSENAAYAVLYAIALTGMSESELKTLQQLFDQGATREAYTYAYLSDDWCAGVFQRLQDGVNIPSAEDMLSLLDEIEAKASESGAQAQTEDLRLMRAAKTYYGVVAERSHGMAAGLLALSESAGGSPVAASVGAAHTDSIARTLSDAGVSLVVVRPRAQADALTTGMMSPQAYARREAGSSALGADSLAAYLDGRRRPRPASAQAWFQQEILTRVALVEALARAQATYAEGEAQFTPQESVDLLAGTPAGSAVEWLVEQGLELVITRYSGSPQAWLEYSLALPEGVNLAGEARVKTGAPATFNSLDDLLVFTYEDLLTGVLAEEGWYTISNQVETRVESDSQ